MQLGKIYTDVGISQIPYSSAIKLPNATAPTRKGSDQYIVGLDVFHQLHCLNMIRKSLYPAYYNGYPQHVETTQNITLEETEDGMAWHLSHCIDSIRQSLMCSSDISTIYWHWLPELDKSAPSTQTTHTCRDFSRIKKWAEEHVLVGEFDDRNPF
ncbi:hypothetical protein B0J14DRAFT_93493 [Halenospora varia]|nr:hypothetical protein B0J14DRAFT_93493 [Halenospora varia]